MKRRGRGEGTGAIVGETAATGVASWARVGRLPTLPIIPMSMMKPVLIKIGFQDTVMSSRSARLVARLCQSIHE
jgi:hypothetical protein